ncbi:hypothetical protein PSCFBP6110_01961 [Pseudomonas syringae pv. cerasicola]|nr:hypothetical protein PSCFBP6110_01961 [Pseudomonas syringae pv. cerasicola]
MKYSESNSGLSAGAPINECWLSYKCFAERLSQRLRGKARLNPMINDHQDWLEGLEGLVGAARAQSVR